MSRRPGVVLTRRTAVVATLAGGSGRAGSRSASVSFLIRTPRRSELSAALGVVFTTPSVPGVLAMEQSGIAGTAFDVHHVITGNLEALVWPTATGIRQLVQPVGARRDAARPRPRLGGDPPPRSLQSVALSRRRSWRSWRRTRLRALAPRPRDCLLGALDPLLLVAHALASVAAFVLVGVVLAVAMICLCRWARLFT